MPLHLDRVRGFCVMPFWQGRHPLVRFSQSIAACRTNAAFTCYCPGNSTPHIISSRTSAQGLLIRKCVFSFAARENTPSAITSTIYTSVASSNVVEAWLVHSRGFISLNLSAKILELTTSSCSIMWTVQRNALVDHRGFRLRVAINWSRSSQRTPAVCNNSN